MAWSYLALKQDHWTDKPSSASGHLAAVDEVLQLAHLHGALKPKAWAGEVDQAGFLSRHFECVYMCSHRLHARFI